MAEANEIKLSQLYAVPNIYIILLDMGVLSEEVLVHINQDWIDGGFTGTGKHALVKGGYCTEQQYERAYMKQAVMTANAAVADMSEVLEATLLKNASLLKLSWDYDKDVDYSKGLTKATVLADAAHSAADVAKTIFILANKNRNNPNFDAVKANDALIAAAGLARYFERGIQFEGVTVNKMVKDAFEGLEKVLLTCGVSSDIAENYISERLGDVQNGLALKQAGRVTEPSPA